MLARGYFEHETPDGGTFDQRILAAGYARPGHGWSLGENLIWADGALATPAALMSSWMDSEGHRDEHPQGRLPRARHRPSRLGTPTGDASRRHGLRRVRRPRLQSGKARGKARQPRAWRQP